MSPTREEVEAVAKKLRKQAVCVYIACEASVADDLAATARTAASMLLDLRTDLDTQNGTTHALNLAAKLRAVEAERDELQGRIANALT